MGFISFSLDYYRKELKKLKNSAVSQEMIYRAKQLLKMLDDLLDEGYTELNETLEESCQGVSLLKEYLRNNNASPFPVYHKAITEADEQYHINELKLHYHDTYNFLCSINDGLANIAEY